MQLISTPGAPTPAGHYSQAVVANGFVFVSGMLPTIEAGKPAPPFAEQARSVLDACGAVLAAAGCGFADVVQTTVYVVGVTHWPEFNQVYAAAFGTHKPARAVIPVPELRHGALLEVQMVACARPA